DLIVPGEGGVFAWPLEGTTYDPQKVEWGEPHHDQWNTSNYEDIIPPQVAVISPNGGEHLEIGETYTIKVKASDNVAVNRIDIFYIMNYPSGAWIPITTLNPHVQSGEFTCSWYIPSSFTPSKNFRIKAICYNGADPWSEDISDADFSTCWFTSDLAGATFPNSQRKLAIDPTSGDIHLLFSDANIVRYAKSEDGGTTWPIQYKQILGDGNFPVIALDDLDGVEKVNICWIKREPGDVLYYSRNFETPEVLFGVPGAIGVGLAPPAIITKNNNIHIVIETAEADMMCQETIYTILYRNFPVGDPSGGISWEPVYTYSRSWIVPPEEPILSPSIYVDVDGNAHISFKKWKESWEGSEIWYATKTATDWNTLKIADGEHSFIDYPYIVYESNNDIWNYNIMNGNTENISNTSAYASIASQIFDGSVITWAEDVGTNYEIYYKLFDKGKWQGPYNLSNTSYDSKYPQIALKNNWTKGTLNCAWVEGNTAPYGISFKKIDIPLPIFVSDITATAESNAQRLVEDANGRLHLVFSCDPIGEFPPYPSPPPPPPAETIKVYHTFSYDGGTTWNKPVEVGIGEKPALALDEDGTTMHCAWVFNNSRDEKLMCSKYNGMSWSNPDTLHGTLLTFDWGIGAPSLSLKDSIAYVTWESATSPCRRDGGVCICAEIYGLGLRCGRFNVNNLNTFTYESVDWIMTPPPGIPPEEKVPIDTIRAVLESPSMVQDNQGIPYILWQGIQDTMRLYSPVALAWTAIIVSDGSGSVKNPNISFSSGLIHCVWAQEYDDNLFDVYHSSFYPQQSLPTLAMACLPIQPPEVRLFGLSRESPFLTNDYLIWSERSGMLMNKYEIYQSQYKDFKWSAPENISNTDLADSKYPVLLYSEWAPPEAVGPTYLYKIWTEGYGSYWIRSEKEEIGDIPATLTMKAGTPEPSPYTVSRDTFMVYGPEPYQSVDMSLPASEAKLIYKIPSLDTTKDNELVMVFYHESKPWELKIEFADILEQEIEVPAYTKFEFRKTLDLSKLEDKVEATIEEGELTGEQQTIFDNLVQNLVNTRTTAEIEIEAELDEGEIEIEEEIGGDFTEEQFTLINDLITSLEAGIIGDKVKLKIETEFEELLLKITGEANPAVLSWFLLYEHPKDTLIGTGGAQSDDRNGNLPRVFALHQNYPNPFSRKTSIQYAVGSRQYVSLKIYDVTGRLVKSLVNGERKPGYYSVNWDAKGFASGIYFVRFVAGDYKATKKLILMK
ncbi:T9SS type A sorting domain-containing protein, partial [candidate division WOR-3 bacterium]|nr:T9SS type A sorting domain-containing protein [candidate division WOR-3 bacterium]